MQLEEIYKIYALNDGIILSFQLDIQIKKFTVKLKARRLLRKQKFDYCIVELEFSEAIEIYIFEGFPTNGDYSDITLIKLNEGAFYLSLDPYDNSGLQNQDDNYTVKAKALSLVDENGFKYEVH